MRSLSIVIVGGALAALPLRAQIIRAPTDGFQAGEPRKYIALLMGPSIPIGAYASSPSANPGTGPARLGYFQTLANFAYRLRGHVGIAASLAYGEFVMEAPGDDDWWQVSMLSIGPMYVRPLGRKLDLELKAKIGVMATAEIIDSYLNDRAAGFAVDLRSGLRYDAFRRWSALAEVGVISSHQSFYNVGGGKEVAALVSGIGVAYRW